MYAWSPSSSWSLTIVGGSLISCGRPSTVSTSLVNALMLSLARALARFLRNLLSRARRDLGAQHGLELVHVQPGVPDVQLPHPCPLVHGPPVRGRHRQVGNRALRPVEAAITSRDGEAGHQPFEVPLERARKGFVEVAEAEDEPAVRSREDPEFDRCASPHSCTVSPVRGTPARSAAIRYAAPRKNVNGDTNIRPYRSGTSSGTRSTPCSSSRLTGSVRSGAGCHSPCTPRGTSSRAARPTAARSARVDVSCFPAARLPGSNLPSSMSPCRSVHQPMAPPMRITRHPPDRVRRPRRPSDRGRSWRTLEERCPTFQ